MYKRLEHPPRRTSNFVHLTRAQCARALFTSLLICVAATSGWSTPFKVAGSAGTLEIGPARGGAARRPQNTSDTLDVHSLVAAAIAGDYRQLEQISTRLKSQPRPPAVDRRFARQLNERGLAFWQRQRFAEAAVAFSQAYQADSGDAEIRENLGYALLMSGDVAQAEPAILGALEIGPDRASAWGSLGIIYAKQGKHREGVASVLVAYRHAPNPKRAYEIYSRQAATYDDPKVRALMSDVVTRLGQMQ